MSDQSFICTEIFDISEGKERKKLKCFLEEEKSYN